MNYRPIYKIASEISKNWRPVNYAAKPYLEAMFDLNLITDYYISDSATGIIARFLGNATSWKGDKAREIKKELNAMLKGKPYTPPAPIEQSDNVGKAPYVEAKKTRNIYTQNVYKVKNVLEMLEGEILKEDSAYIHPGIQTGKQELVNNVLAKILKDVSSVSGQNWGETPTVTPGIEQMLNQCPINALKKYLNS